MAAIPQIDETQAREIRRLRRDFIRAHHPDRGGDADFFAAGLRAFDTGWKQDSGLLPQVVIIKRRLWLSRLLIASARRVRYGPRPPRAR